MFEIEYKGGNCITITTKKSKIVTDPRLSLVGLKDIPVKNSIQIVTEERFLVKEGEVALTIYSPGEYEIGDFWIRGIPAIRHIDTDATEPISTIFRIDIGDVRIVILGNVAASLTEDQLEAIGVVDIAIVPVGGGGYTLDHVNATKLVRLIDPKVVMPIHYADPALKYEVTQDSLDLFIKEMGSPVETTLKYKLKSSSALPEVISVVEIKRS